MTVPSDWFPTTAEEIRERNAALDSELLRIAERLPAGILSSTPGGNERTVGQVLAHLAEQPRFVADDLAGWLEGAEQVGRAQPEPTPLASPAEAARADLHALLDTVRNALRALADVLDRLEDTHLDARTNNRKYGEEPLVAYLDRYILSHKAEHTEQLRRVAEQARNP